MTDAQKIAGYDEIVALLRDRVELERHYQRKGFLGSTIDHVRLDGYMAVVELVFGDEFRRNLQREEFRSKTSDESGSQIADDQSESRQNM